MPLKTVGSAILVWAPWYASFAWMGVRVRAGLLQRGERRLNALALVFRNQAGKHLPECGVLGARVNVLPAVSFEECGVDRPRLGLADRAAALCREVTCIGFGLGLQESVPCGDHIE